MDKRHKKIIRRILITLGVFMIIGIGLFAIGQSVFSTPLTTAGLIVAGISLFPILVISIVLFLRQGSK